MKCTYCGRENDDSSAVCSECGVELLPPLAPEISFKVPKGLVICLTLIIIYAPLCLIFFVTDVSHPWDLIRMGPVLPGMVISLCTPLTLLLPTKLSGAYVYMFLSVITLVFLSAVIWVLLRLRGAPRPALLGLLILSCLLGLGLYQLMRA
jgi:hypothetical protein